MFLCLKRFDEIIRVGNLLDYGLAERFFERILFELSLMRLKMMNAHNVIISFEIYSWNN